MRSVHGIAAAALLGLGLGSSAAYANDKESLASLTDTIHTTCAVCHNDVLREQFAGLSLQHYDVARAHELAPITEK